MTFEIRDYQEKILGDIRGEFQKGHRCVLAVAPTGAGKTGMSAEMIKRTVANGGTALFTVHRQELMDQTTEEFTNAGIEHGCIANGYDFNPAMPVQLCSIDTLRRRLDRFPFAPSLIGIDEAAHSCSPTWKSVIDFFPKSRIVGLTATPERLDGKGLGSIYSSMVMGPTTRWLIDRGYLSDYEVFEPGIPDTSRLDIRGGDYAQDQAQELMDTPSITGDAIREYKRHSDGKRAVAFCVSVVHSQHVAQKFIDAGVSAIHVGGDTPRAQRRAAINAFRNGEIKVLTSVDIFGEGFNLPAMETAILLRPTESLALYLQQVGRVLRTYPGKKRALILDHAGNVQRHFLPDEPRVWSLEGRKKKKKKEKEAEVKIKIRNCTECLFVHRPMPACPYCGHVYPIMSREVEHKPGELVMADKNQLRQKKRAEDQLTRDAVTIEQLEAVGIERGYKEPFKWAEIKLAQRERRAPNFARAAAREKRHA